MNLGTPEQQNVENIKQSILVIEGLCFALNNSHVPFKFSEACLKGYSFLTQMHNQLIGQLPPDELQKMKAQYNQPPTDSIPNATPA